MNDIEDVPDLLDAPEELKEFVLSFMHRWHSWSKETFDIWSHNKTLRMKLLDIHYSTNFQLIVHYKKLNYRDSEIGKSVVYNYCKKRMGLKVD